MAQSTSQVSRRLTTSLHRPIFTTHITPATTSPFSSTALSRKAPSLSDIHPDGAPAFGARQQEFRNRLKAAKEQADSQSHPSPTAASAAASHVSNSAAFHSSASSHSSTSSVIAEHEKHEPKNALGSLSNHNTGDAREAARKQQNTSAPSSSDAEDGKNGGGKKKGALSTLIYGTEEGRQHDQEIERSFSQVLARGKYVHSIVFHEVKPDKVDEYVDLVGDWYPKVAGDAANKVHLVGSWRTEVGDCDTFVHIWEYQRYHGYHDSLHTIWNTPSFNAFDHKLKPLLHAKRTSLMQEFSFWPTTPPRQLGGLFELRSYHLHPGNLLEWETHWRKGLAARRQLMEGVGAWFVQIGDLNTVHHLWQFADLEERRVRREQSWMIEGWADTVHRTVPLIQTMKSRILIPMPWSPVG